MATAYIAEFSVLPRDIQNDRLMLPDHPAIAQQEVDFTGGETESAAFNESTRLIRITSDATLRYLVGAAGADAENNNSNYLLAGTVEYIGVSPGDIISLFVNA